VSVQAPSRTVGDQVSQAPMVSVIIPAFNAAQFIREALESVFSQTRSDYEPIIINDGSPDTRELEAELAPYMSRIVYLKQENRGLSGARNSGIRHARGRYIALLDADDIWEPDYLAVQIAILEKDKQAAIVYSNALIFGVGPHVGKEYLDTCPSEGDVTFQSLVTQRCNVMVSVLGRREAIIGAGMFDETLRSCEDYDLWLRMAHRGSRIVYHRKVLVRYRRHSASLSADALWMYDNGLKVLEKLKDTLSLTKDDDKALNQQVARFVAMKNLVEGKKAIEAGSIDEAIVKLDLAHSLMPTRKLAWTLLFLRHAPWTLKRIFSIRQRYEPGRQV
jgi:glycosyltransferase involved in cell wall biosynthesis